MLSKLYRLLGARKNEEKAVESLLLYGFFMGIFLASFQPASLNLFIKHYKDSLDQAYLFQGLWGLVGALVFTFLHRYIRFSILVKSQPIFILIVTVLGYYHYEIQGNTEAAYLLFIFFGPFQVISALIFWGLFGRIFQTHQSKRIIGGIDTGTLTAMIFVFFMIPVLTSDSIGLLNESIDLFYISVFGICGLFFITLLTARRFKINELEKLKKEEVKELSFVSLSKNRLTLYLGFFLIVSTLIARFVDFSYINVIDLQYPNETERLNFISFAEGSIMILSFIMQTFFNDRIIFNYGLRVSLMILPIILLIFTLMAIATGLVIDFSTGILPFFILIAVSKIISSALRDSLENPTFKLFFLIFKPRTRFEIQNKIEGVINQLGTILAGSIMTLLGMNLFFEFDSTHALIVLVIAIGVLFNVVTKMYDNYRDSLRESLKASDDLHIVTSKSLALAPLLEKELKEGDWFSKVFAYKAMEIADPIQIRQRLFEGLFSQDKLIRGYTLRRVHKLKAFKGVALVDQVVKFEEDEDLRQYAEKVHTELDALVKKQVKSFHFFIMGKSENPTNREFLAKILVRYPGEQYQQILIDLMRDKNHYVRIAAVVSAVSINNPKLWSVLLDMLKDPKQSSLSVCALVAIGPPIIKSLEFEFNKSHIGVEVKKSIITVFGRLGNERCLDRLWYYFQDPDPLIQLEAAKSLISKGVNANLLQIFIVKKQILKYAELLFWNKMAISELNYKEDKEIIAAIKNENNFNVDAIFKLLSLIYDTESIKLIRDNIYSQNYDRIAFSVELIDVLMDEDIKKTLIAIFDEISVQEMAQRLEFTFYRRDFSREALLYELISRSGSNIDIYTKCLALELLLIESENPFRDDIVANLFHNSFMVRELTFYYFNKHDVSKTMKMAMRLEKHDFQNLKRNIDAIGRSNATNNDQLQFHKIKWLKRFSLFSIMDNRDIIELVKHFQEVKIRANEVLVKRYEWREKEMYIVMSGNIEEFDDYGYHKIYKEGDLIGISSLFDLDDSGECKTLTDVIIYEIPRQIFYDAIIGNERYYQRVKELIRNKYEELFLQEKEIIEIVG